MTGKSWFYVSIHIVYVGTKFEIGAFRVDRIIRNNKVRWAALWSKERIDAGREYDLRQKQLYFEDESPAQFSLMILLLFLSALDLVAQEQNNKQIFENGWGIPEVPLNCETNFVRLEQTRSLIRAQTNKNGVLILIARLGDSEKRRELNRRRLDNIRKGLNITLGVVEKIVVAEGESVKGFGRVEFYLGGEMIGALLAKKNSDIYVSCESASNDKNPNLNYAFNTSHTTLKNLRSKVSFELRGFRVISDIYN